MDILRSIKVSDALPASKKIIILTGEETIQEAFKARGELSSPLFSRGLCSIFCNAWLDLSWK